MGTGGYTVSVRSLGEEDHGNFPDEATVISPDGLSTPNPRSVFGRFEYPRDEDWFRFEATPGRTYRLLFDLGSSATPRIVPAVALFAGSNLRAAVLRPAEPRVYLRRAGVGHRLHRHESAPGRRGHLRLQLPRELTGTYGLRGPPHRR